jgi:hypothetical protein
MFQWPMARWTWPPPVTAWPGPCAQPFLECNPCRAPGTGILPGVIAPVKFGGKFCHPIWPTHNQFLEAWRAWQRCSGCTPSQQQPIPGHRPPNLFLCPTPAMLKGHW